MTEKEHRGYVILAMQDFEYEQATALAYSIKIHNKDASVALVTNYIDRVPAHYTDIFDHIIALPFGSNEITRTNDWQLYWATPYTHNIVIDCASLVKENHITAWEYLEDHYDTYFFDASFNFKGEQLVNKRFIEYKTEYKLLPVHSHMFYFKHDTTTALAFFKLADVFMQNWRDVYAHYLKENHRPATYVNDIIYSLINSIVLFESNTMHDNIMHTINMPLTLTDGDIGSWNKWTDRLNVWNSSGAKVKIQNFAIATNLYYGEQEFMTEDIFNGHRDTYNSTGKR